jgi:hypothetical protein
VGRDQFSSVETIPTASSSGYGAVDHRLGSGSPAQVVAQKPFRLGQSRSDGSCVSFQLPKVRMVRVPRIASVGQKATPQRRLRPRKRRN